MNLAHIHLLLNHFPTVGTAVGLGLFLVALAMKSADLTRASLAVFVVIALIAMPTYMSGNAAMEMIQNHAGVNKDVIEAHQSWALLAYIVLEVGGLFAWIALWQSRRKGEASGWLPPAVLALMLVSFGLMAQAANIGGEIMHPEIAGPEGPTTAAIEALKGSVLGPAVVESSWLWAACETLHFMGLAILFGVVLILDLRMLGVVKGVSFAALHKLLPWAAGAFAVNTATGMVFFIAAFEQYTTNDVFHWKLAFILLAGLNALYFTVFDQPWRIQAGEDAPWQAKAVAASAMVLWIGVIYCGRMLPFLGGAF
jgi:uncharacterized membrane protein